MHAIGIFIISLIVIRPGAYEDKTVTNNKFLCEDFRYFICEMMCRKSAEEANQLSIHAF